MNRRLILLPLFAIAAFVVWKVYDRPGPSRGTPAVTWRAGGETEFAQGRNYLEVPWETTIRASLHCDEPRHVYVFSHSDEDGTLLLFPSTMLKTDRSNPLPPGQNVLPGQHDGKDLAWTTRSGIAGVTTFVVVAAEQPVPELSALLPKLRMWTNSSLPSGEPGVTNPSNGEPPLAGPHSREFPAPVLQRAAALSADSVNPNGPMQADPQLPGVWLASWRVVPKKP